MTIKELQQVSEFLREPFFLSEFKTLGETEEEAEEENSEGVASEEEIEEDK